MDTGLLFLILIITLALVFDYINGFHDAANAIATVVSTRVLSPRVAVLYGAVLNFIGALMGTEVAATVGKGIVNQGVVTLETVFCALLAAITWNLITWVKGLPSSSSHALIGSLVGAAIAAGLLNNLTWSQVLSSEGNVINWAGFVGKIVLPMVTSPLIGVIVGYILMGLLTWLVYRLTVNRINFIFGKLQIVSAGLMALSHGHNDAQKSMGIIGLALATFFPHKGFSVDLWVIVACATAIALGTLSGGWKIIRTLGSKMIKLQPIHGFAAETTSFGIIMAASDIGIPLSTTHVISSAIMGVGASKRLSAVKWGVVGSILWAWVLTIPVTVLLAMAITWVFNAVQGLLRVWLG
jgi:PiT family inorganic phosphate transporter